MNDKMKIEIWSDIMCPFCYIGKRRLEKSLANSPYKDNIEIEWKSFQLNPDLTTDLTLSATEYLSQKKGFSIDDAKGLYDNVTRMAKEEGLDYHFEIAKVANSFKAHVLAHYAKAFGKQDEAEELLFKSYFTEGKNIDDITVLQNIARQLDLDADKLAQVISDGSLDDEVKMDIHESRQIGVTGVPFFVYDRKYAVSGAQPLELFEQTLEKAFSEFKSSSTLQINVSDSGSSCDINGNCD